MDAHGCNHEDGYQAKSYGIVVILGQRALPWDALICHQWPRQHQKRLEYCCQHSTDQQQAGETTGSKPVVVTAQLDLFNTPNDRCASQQHRSP